LPHCHAFFNVFPALLFSFDLFFISDLFTSIYIYFLEKFFYYYSSWQCGNGGNGFLESFIILGICFRISVEIRKRVAIVAMLPCDEITQLLLKRRETRRLKIKQQNQLIKQRQGLI